jgi:hypothetical protein
LPAVIVVGREHGERTLQIGKPIQPLHKATLCAIHALYVAGGYPKKLDLARSARLELVATQWRHT